MNTAIKTITISQQKQGWVARCVNGDGQVLYLTSFGWLSQPEYHGHVYNAVCLLSYWLINGSALKLNTEQHREQEEVENLQKRIADLEREYELVTTARASQIAELKAQLDIMQHGDAIRFYGDECGLWFYFKDGRKPYFIGASNCYITGSGNTEEATKKYHNCITKEEAKRLYYVLIKGGNPSFEDACAHKIPV